MNRKYVTVAITPDTKILLENAGRKGQTFNEIIQELLSKWGCNVN